MSILVKFVQLLGQTLVKLGQILVKIVIKPNSDILRVQKCLISNFEKFDPLDQILIAVQPRRVRLHQGPDPPAPKSGGPGDLLLQRGQPVHHLPSGR